MAKLVGCVARRCTWPPHLAAWRGGEHTTTSDVSSQVISVPS
jgi:hypothetical protein